MLSNASLPRLDLTRRYAARVTVFTFAFPTTWNLGGSVGAVMKVRAGRTTNTH